MRKAFDITIATFIFLSATFYVMGKTFGYAQGLIFELGICLLFAISLFLKPLRFRINPWMNLIPVLAIVSFMSNASNIRGVAVQPLVHIFMALIFFYIIINHVKDRSYIYNAICAVIAVNSLMVFLQFIGKDPLCLNDVGLLNKHLVGLFGYKYVLGHYMAMVIPLLLMTKRYPFAALAFILVIASKSWAAGLIAVVGISFCLWFINKKIFTVFLAFFIIAGTAGGLYLEKGDNPILKVSSKVKVRLELQHQLLSAAIQNPYIGNGLGTFKHAASQVLKKHTHGVILDAWNDYIEFSMDIGLGVIFIVFMLYRRVWVRFRDEVKSPELIGIMGALVTVPLGMALHTYANHFNLMVVLLCILSFFEIKTGVYGDVTII